MVRNVYLGGKRITLSSSMLMGQGGEAEIFSLKEVLSAGEALALKVWMPPDHPAFAGSDREALRNQQAAAARIREYGEKLRHFPRGLPPQVIQPRELALSGAQEVVGYTMELLENTEPLRVFGQRHYRLSKGIEAPAVLRLFKALHATLRAAHRAQVVVGDFNYLNVLVRGETPYLIDTDSFQYGKWLCRGFTTRFVDPLICDPAERLPVQVRPHSALTDWYAYALMLFECLMFVGPYGGVYRPLKKSDVIPEDSRPLRRISVFHPQVVYPQKAQPLSWLPRGAQDFYGKVFENDWRGEFPLDLLEVLQAHAEGRSPVPTQFTPVPGLVEQVRGSVRIRKRYQEAGVIVTASVDQGQLALVRYVSGQLVREDGRGLLTTPPDPGLQVKISGARTVIVKGSTLVVLDSAADPLRYSVDSYQGRFPVFDTNARHYYWLAGGILYRDDHAGPRMIGEVLKNQTRLFVGPRFGVGFARVGSQLQGYVFDAERPGINDAVTLPPVRGEIVDAACYFSSNRAWLFLTLKTGPQLVNRCMVIRPDGTVSGMAEVPEGSGTWLGSIRGKCAATVTDNSKSPATQGTHRLFSVTADGLVGVDDLDPSGGGAPPVLTAHFPETRDFLEDDASLLPSGSTSVLQVSKQGVWQLVFA